MALRITYLSPVLSKSFLVDGVSVSLVAMPESLYAGVDFHRALRSYFDLTRYIDICSNSKFGLERNLRAKDPPGKVFPRLFKRTASASV